jgi:hypothetical protein
MNDLPAAATIALRLAQSERVAASELSQRTKSEFQPLLVSGIIKIDGNRRGEVYMAVHPVQLRDWVMRRYPKASGAWVATTSGARNILHNRNTKSRPRSERTLVLLLRGIGPVNVTRNGRLVPVAEMTAAWGAAACALGPADEASIVGACALVENPELFWHASPACGVPQPLVLFKDGRASDRLVTWLETCTQATFVLYVDFDPVGLDEYRRLRNVLGEQVTLYLPENLPALFRQFGNEPILAKEANVALLKSLRAENDAAIQSVIELIDKHACVLEQEAMLIGSTG